MDYLLRILITNFNPRSREGSDQSKCSSLLHHDNFNPRSREGSDHDRELLRLYGCNFNPRSREGSDSIY